MFFVNAEDGAVMQMDKFGRGVPVTVSTGHSNPRAVRVVHPLKYNQVGKQAGQEAEKGATN